MAYDKVKIFNDSLQIIREHKLYFIEDIVAYLPCAKPTFYDMFPPGSNELNELKEELSVNRVHTKVKMRKKWEDSDNATLQMGLMKLIGTEEEAHRLNGTKQEIRNTTPSVTIQTNDTGAATDLIDKLSNE